MDPRSAEQLLEVVARLAARDGRVTPEEQAALDALARRLAVPQDAAARVLAAAFAADPSAPLRLPADAGARRTLLDDLQQVALADGRLDPREVAFMERIRGRLSVVIERPAGSLTRAEREDAAREDAERLRRRGPVRRLREAAFAALFCLVAVVLPVGASGLVDSYEGTVHAREHENHHMGSRSHTSYHLVLDPPARVEVPKVVHDAAAPGVRVRKRFGAPWWTFAGRPCFGPAAVGFTAALLGVLFATWVHFRRDPDLAHVVAIVTVFTAWLCGWATEVTAGGGLAPAVTLGAGLLLVARVLRSGPRRRAA